MKTMSREWKLTRLRDLPLPDTLLVCEEPRAVVTYWHRFIATSPTFSEERESLFVLHLNTRRRPLGHHLVAHGTVDTVLLDTLSVFRVAVVANARAIVLIHNHPSGDPSPSEGDIRSTTHMIEAGAQLRIEVLDHVIIGSASTPYVSLREMGYFSASAERPALSFNDLVYEVNSLNRWELEILHRNRWRITDEVRSRMQKVERMFLEKIGARPQPPKVMRLHNWAGREFQPEFHFPRVRPLPPGRRLPEPKKREQVTKQALSGHKGLKKNDTLPPN